MSKTLLGHPTRGKGRLLLKMGSPCRTDPQPVSLRREECVSPAKTSRPRLP